MYTIVQDWNCNTACRKDNPKDIPFYEHKNGRAIDLAIKNKSDKAIRKEIRRLLRIAHS